MDSIFAAAGHSALANQRLARTADDEAVMPAPGRSRSSLAARLARLFHRERPIPASPQPDAPPESLLDSLGQTCRAVLTFLHANGLDPTPDHYQLAWTCEISPTSVLGVAVTAEIQARGRLSQTRAAMLLSEHRAESVAQDLTELLTQAQVTIADGNQVFSRSQSDMSEFGQALRKGLVAASAGAPAATLSNGMISLAETMIRQVSESEQRLRDVSSQLSIAQNRAAKAERLANIDPLTGLANRRAFARILDGAIADANTTGRPLSIAYCDIDRFKALNDVHGHGTGDRVLRYVAKMLDRLSDGACHVARHGGEEFVLLFRDKTADEALVLVDDVRADLATRNLKAFDTRRPIGRVTFSAGIAILRDGHGASELLHNADLALYRAKNRVLLLDDAA